MGNRHGFRFVKREGIEQVEDKPRQKRRSNISTSLRSWNNRTYRRGHSILAVREIEIHTPRDRGGRGLSADVERRSEPLTIT